MRILITFFLLPLLMACNPEAGREEQTNKTYPFYVGTYTDGDSEGIYRYSLQSEGKIVKSGLAAKTKNPSFLAINKDRRFLVAANETNIEGMGTVESFRLEGDSLALINRSPSGGAHPCFVSMNSADYILVANYSGGNVGLLKMNKKGELSGLLDIQQHVGKGTTDRQEAPHAHSAWFAGDCEVTSVDLGTNELWFSHLDTNKNELMPNHQQKLGMETGAGPRHLALHPNGKWIYVLNELNSTITLVIKNEGGSYERGPSGTTLPAGYSDANYCADIHISPDGKFVYASNRGHNSIAIYGINKRDGFLEFLAHEDTRGDWPRNFSLTPDGEYLVVANQYSNNIVSFKRDKTTGLLTFLDQTELAAPVCIEF